MSKALIKKINFVTNIHFRNSRFVVEGLKEYIRKVEKKAFLKVHFK